MKQHTQQALDMGCYLQQGDARASKEVTLRDIYAETMPDSTEPKLVAVFEEEWKMLILSKSNIRRLTEMFKTPHTGDWRGKVELFFDACVEIGDTTSGGFQLRAGRTSGAS